MWLYFYLNNIFRCFINNILLGKNQTSSPGWCGSVDWVLTCEPKGHGFNSQSGHMPGLQARSPEKGMWQATTQRCFSPSLSPSLPLSLKINSLFFLMSSFSILIHCSFPSLIPISFPLFFIYYLWSNSHNISLSLSVSPSLSLSPPLLKPLTLRSLRLIHLPTSSQNCPSDQSNKSLYPRNFWAGSKRERLKMKTARKMQKTKKRPSVTVKHLFLTPSLSSALWTECVRLPQMFCSSSNLHFDGIWGWGLSEVTKSRWSP